MSLLTFNQVSLKLAENIILDKANLVIQPKDRIALIGRNGAGKSTFIQLLQGDIVPDDGIIQKQNQLVIAGLIQHVPHDDTAYVYHFLCRELDELGKILINYYTATLENNTAQRIAAEEKIDALQAWDMLPKIETLTSHLGLTLYEPLRNLSGGMKRRALLGAALIKEPQLLLLDEPTNHLDIESIEWLESYLAQYTGSIVFVTHDRKFLNQVANRIVELDRGILHSHQCDYETYLNRRESIRLSEEKQNQLFDKELKKEEAWIRQGIEARRTRNEGRVRRLKSMRKAHQERREQLSHVKKVELTASYSGKIVFDSQHLNYALENKHIIKDFSLLLTRGDKIGIIGPNGCGKTTLVRLLLGELEPQSGTIQRGTSLEIGYFDQLRHQLDEKDTVLNNVADGADFVTINGQKKHVATYLREFLFSSERFNQPVFSLSGGEKNRLLLAKLLAKPINLLVMDEPTNDLDIETLEMLETMLVDYPGTLIIISHDRAFLDHIISSLLVFEDGKFNEYIGGYEDYLRLKQQHQTQIKKTQAPMSKPEKENPPTRIKLSYNEQRELKELPLQIERLEKEIQQYHEAMSDSAFYQKNASEIIEFNTNLAALESQLKTHYQRWEELEERS